jgi:hypothetical protein
MSWIRRHIKVLAPLTIVALAGVAVLAFGVFGVHTLFIDDRVDEDGPVFASGAAAATDTLPEVAAAPPTSASSAATEEPSTTDASAATDAPQIVTLAQGEFIPRGRYSGEGTAVVLNDGSEQRFLRFENFSTDNGPDLRVYLTVSDAEGDSGAFDDDFVDLGVLKGNIGDQNYEIPPDVDLSVYDTVVVWCVRFATPFTAADLA